MRHIEVLKMDENSFKIVFTRRFSNGELTSHGYTIGKNSYGNRNLPRILEKANHSFHESFKPKGSPIKWAGGVWRKDIPEKTTYTFYTKENDSEFFYGRTDNLKII